MAIIAHLQQAEGHAGAPREPRRTLNLEAQGSLESGGATKVLVHNISATGLLMESTVALSGEEWITIELPQAGSCRARIVWSSSDLYGCQFETAIPKAVLSAAQLRSAVSDKVDIAESRAAESRAPAPDTSFGVRLQQLRAARGLSQSQIANALGVSKPTVWAWEHGKARPVEERLDGLAEVLGVDRGELHPRQRASTLEDLVARHREQIAAAVGTSPNHVRISIEL